MPTINVNDPVNQRTYQVNGPVYEAGHVWCGVAEDTQYGKCFVKLLKYGQMIPQERISAQKWAENEAGSMLRAAKCTDRVPKLYAHWNDRKNGVYVLVMEHLPGVTLDKWMEKRPVKDPDETTLFVRSLLVRQLAEILAQIHFKIPGISHRDLKPQNVMIRLDENKHWQVKLIDFGTAGQSFSVGGGTSGYQAPEQVSVEGTLPGSGAAKDMFALGIIWCQLLSGQDAESIRWSFVQAFDGPKWEERPGLPDWVNKCKMGERYQRLFEKMTDFDPAKRPDFMEVARNISQRRQRL